eukprot:4520682-Pyramimonas_sp.AAC.1
MEGESFSTCGSHLSAAHIRFQHLQELHGLRAAPFQQEALALPPRTFYFNRCTSFTDSHVQRTGNGVLEGFMLVRVHKLC